MPQFQFRPESSLADDDYANAPVNEWRYVPVRRFFEKNEDTADAFHFDPGRTPEDEPTATEARAVDAHFEPEPASPSLTGIVGDWADAL